MSKINDDGFLELSGINVTSKEELKEEFASKLEELTKGVEELATSEEPTSKKPQEFKALTRAEKAAKLGAAIRANKK